MASSHWSTPFLEAEEHVLLADQFLGRHAVGEQFGDGLAIDGVGLVFEGMHGDGRPFDGFGVGELAELAGRDGDLLGRQRRDPHQLPHRLGQRVEAEQRGERGRVFHAVDHVVEGLGQGGPGLRGRWA